MSHKPPGRTSSNILRGRGGIMNASNVEKFSCTRMQHKHAITCLGFCAQRHGSKMSEGNTYKKRACSLLVNTTQRHYDSWNKWTLFLQLSSVQRCSKVYKLKPLRCNLHYPCLSGQLRQPTLLHFYTSTVWLGYLSPHVIKHHDIKACVWVEIRTGLTPRVLNLATKWRWVPI